METLMAVGTLAIGMTFVGGTFMTGIYFATVSTERTIAAVAVDEAFAKMRLYGLDPNGTAALGTGGFVPYEQLMTIPADEFFYPSTSGATERHYSWAALCRRVDDDPCTIQCTVFVSRSTGANSTYWVRSGGALMPSSVPHPLRIAVESVVPFNAREMLIKDDIPTDSIDELAFVNDGSILVNDATGEIYHVLERLADTPNRVRLDRPWIRGTPPLPVGAWMWVVPPAAAGGRNPVVGVYQKILRLPSW
jgi:hypothetical protein